MYRKVSNQIAIQACRQIKCQQAKMEYGNLSDIKKEIIYKIMYKERSATEIAAQIRKDRTTVSRYLNELKDLDLITSNTRGRESVYDVSLPVRMIFEMEYMPQEVRRGEDIREGEVTYGKAQNN